MDKRSRSDLHQTIGNLGSPISSEAPEKSGTLTTADLKLLSSVTTLDLSALDPGRRDRIMFDCITALYRWHSSTNSETNEFRWYAPRIPTIDPQKLIAAWSGSQEVMTDAIDVIQQLMDEYDLSKKSNLAAREDNRQTRAKIDELLRSNEVLAASQKYVTWGQIAVVTTLICLTGFLCATRELVIENHPRDASPEVR